MALPVAFALFLVLHGLIHILGAAKAFDWAELPQLTQPISPGAGVLWLLSAGLLLAAAAALFLWPRGWWLIGGVAVVLSTGAVVPSWTDARFGAFANLVVLAGVVFGFLCQGPFSLRAEYDRDVDALIAASVPAAESPVPVTEADLAHLPAPVQRYLRLVGVVGQPRIYNFRVSLHGRIRSGPDARWMPLSVEQHSVVDPPARLFYMTATMLGIPAQGYHRYIGAAASMRVKAAALVPVATSSGREMTQSETVTLFNEMCLYAPATLIDPAIEWEAVDDRTARAQYTNAGHTIHAELVFNDAGELVDFVSTDRYELQPDGTVRLKRWTTPVGGYRSFGPVRLFSRGEGRWHDPAGEYAYLELLVDAVEYNVRAGR